MFGINIPDNLNAVDFEDLTVSTTALGVTATKLKRGAGPESSVVSVRAVIVTCNTQSIRYRIDGAAAPTATLGHRLAPGETLLLMGSANILRFRAIREGGTDANVSVTFLA